MTAKRDAVSIGELRARAEAVDARAVVADIDAHQALVDLLDAKRGAR